ncbi:MAG TPA: sulfite exporter TauE/SafE family protein [Candidatus Limnocylindrales bacterium]|nr:sulfite exporter TauE/SafE family protein [Candidatus Limnocylindrales bacterium]
MIAGLVLLGGGVAAGVFGSLLGLGGGILIVPLLTLGFGLPLREAVAISLVSVIVTSSASAAVYLQRHVANLRLGMTLELFSALGALVGGLVAFLISERVLAGLFAALMTWVAISMARRKDPPKVAASASEPVAIDSVATAPEHLIDVAPVPAVTDPSFAAALSGPGYRIHRLPAGMIGSVFAGLNSALLGVGGGIIKVPVMHLVMGVPLRTSTATSNMMMGITATASAVIYLLRDEIDPFVAGPICLGVFIGASAGSRLAHRVDVRILRWLFVIVLIYTAFQMAMRALGL